MILDIKELSRIANEVNTRIAYARGAFDILHAGHIEFLEYAKQQAGILVVGIISGKIIRQNKGDDRPIKSGADRLHVIDSIKYVDYSFIVPEPTETKLSTEIVIETLRPHVFVLFNEKPSYTEHFQKILKQYNVRLALDNSNKKASTSDLIKKIRKG